jgi:hypothetical protein
MGVTYNVIRRSLTPTMTPRRVTTFRIDEEVLDAMQVVFERDGVPAERRGDYRLHQRFVRRRAKMKRVAQIL